MKYVTIHCTGVRGGTVSIKVPEEEFNQFVKEMMEARIDMTPQEFLREKYLYGRQFEFEKVSKVKLDKPFHTPQIEIKGEPSS